MADPCVALVLKSVYKWELFDKLKLWYQMSHMNKILEGYIPKGLRSIYIY